MPVITFTDFQQKFSVKLATSTNSFIQVENEKS